MPRSFEFYILPASDIPVCRGGEELGRIDIPASGGLTLELPEHIIDEINAGFSLVLPKSEVSFVEGHERLRLEMIVIHTPDGSLPA